MQTSDGVVREGGGRVLVPRFGDVVVTSVEEALVFVERSPTCQQSISLRAHFHLTDSFHIPSRCSSKQCV